eukprot:TRINITY_DN342_c0_g1_i1.p1 TRINITY_DN342_c0_g1~~TRINITY_DN342_c0_g1_i1.p1  ORF type:complete len:1124 (-),score=402.12 TRINITY_DN342_c0_g1_i1:1319-4690(-)
MQGQLSLKKSEGFLKKTVWKQYWFKLTDQSFICSKTEDYEDVEDTIKIDKDVSLTGKKNSDGKSVMTVAQKAKKWTLMAETEDSLQRWQEAVKAVVTKAGGKVAATKLKPEDIVIERTDLPTKRDSRTDSLGGPPSNPSTPRAAREEQPQHQSGEFSVSGGEPSSTDSQDKPAPPTRSPSVQQLGGPPRPFVKKPPLPPRPGETKSPSPLPPRPDENGSGNTSDASGASSPAQTDSPTPMSPPDPANRKMFRAPSQSVVTLNNSGGSPVPTPPSRGPGKGPMPGRGKFSPGPGGPGLPKEGVNPVAPPRGPNGMTSPPPLSPKKSVSALLVNQTPAVDPPQPEQPANEIPSPRERAPTMMGEKEAHRGKIAREILETERGYFKCINSLITFYLGPLTSQAAVMNVPIEHIKTLFPTNLEMIIQFNKELLAQLEERINNFTPMTTIGDVFMKLSPFLKMYNEYSSAYQTALNMYNQLRKDNPLFVKELETCRKSSGSQLTLEDLIIMPVQRIPRYKLLLEDFLKNTDKAHIDYVNLSAALSKVNEVAAFINESVRKSDNAKKMMGMSSKGANFDNLIAPHRFLIRDGSNKVTEHKRKEMKHFFLFNDLFVHVKESLMKDGHDLSNPEFVWPLNLVWINEALLPKKVEIIGPNGSMTLNVKNDQSWVKDLKTHCQNLLNLLNENDPAANNNNSHRKGKYTYPGGSIYDGDWIDGHRQGLGTFSQCGNIYTGEWVNDKRNGKGRLIFANGYEYDGTWKDDMPNGKGTMLTPDNGAKYEGDWKDGKRHGTGHLVFPNGDVYDGEFADDGISGRGKLTCSSGMVYEGEFKDDMFHGIGKLILPSKTAQLAYEGGFKQGLKHGRGVLKYPHGAVYEGEWQEDMRHGKGVMKEKDNSTYEGDWANDMYDGQGVKNYPNGSRYNGHWSRGVKKGQGQFIYSNGTRYDGNWADDMRQGVGGFVDCDGSTYQGEWAADRREGKGVMTYSSGARYDGYWHFDKFHKTGTFTGGAEDLISKYEGEWQNGRMHGKGTLHFTNGDVFKGSFKDNKFHGQAVYNYANGCALNSKWNYGVKEGKTMFTTQDKETFSGSIKEPLSNVIEEKGDLLHIAPTFPLMPIYFDTETGRTSLSRN